MTSPDRLIKSFDPFMFMSYKSGFTAFLASVLHKPQRGRGKAVTWDLETVFAPLTPPAADIRPFELKLLLQSC